MTDVIVAQSRRRRATTLLIEAAADADIRPIVCRQERVGIGIADGFARVTNGRTPSAFAVQRGPGAENAFPGTIVLKNATMVVEMKHMALSHEKYRTRDVGGDYADIARALGGWSEVVRDPAEIASTILRARKAT